MPRSRTKKTENSSKIDFYTRQIHEAFNAKNYEEAWRVFERRDRIKAQYEGDQKEMVKWGKEFPLPSSVPDSNGQYLFHKAAATGDVAIISKLLSYSSMGYFAIHYPVKTGIDGKKVHLFPIHYAIGSGNTKAVAMLIEMETRVNIMGGVDALIEYAKRPQSYCFYDAEQADKMVQFLESEKFRTMAAKVRDVPIPALAEITNSPVQSRLLVGFVVKRAKPSSSEGIGAKRNLSEGFDVENTQASDASSVASRAVTPIGPFTERESKRAAFSPSASTYTQKLKGQTTLDSFLSTRKMR